MSAITLSRVIPSRHPQWQTSLSDNERSQSQEEKEKARTSIDHASEKVDLVIPRRNSHRLVPAHSPSAPHTLSLSTNKSAITYEAKHIPAPNNAGIGF
eukprot:2054753-Rhodomonas_salina.1